MQTATVTAGAPGVMSRRRITLVFVGLVLSMLVFLVAAALMLLALVLSFLVEEIGPSLRQVRTAAD